MAGEPQETTSMKVGRWVLFGAPAVACIGFVLASLSFAGVNSMDVVRDCLWAAFGFGVIGTWLEPDLRALRFRYRAGATLIVALALGAGLYWLGDFEAEYMRTHAQAPIVQKVAAPTAKPADVRINPIDPEKLRDGTYYLPIEIADNGEQSVNGYASIFKQQQFPFRPSVAQQEDMMATLETMLRKGHLSLTSVQDSGGLIAPGFPRVLRETLQKLSEAQMAQRTSATLFPYYGVVFVYSDDDAKRDHLLYYAERCTYFDGNISTYIDCAGHNFSRKIWR